MRASRRAVAFLGAAIVGALGACADPDPSPPACTEHCADVLPPDACMSGTIDSGDGECRVPGPVTCPTGFTRDGTVGCIEVAASTCPGGTYAKLGESNCVAVGVASCSQGFERDPSGFGCVPIVAPSCPGASRRQLGSSTCVPIGDCATPPPADADHFVDPSFGPTKIDATHHRSIADAVAAAQHGETVSVESGTYRETVRIEKSIRLVGRCAEQVVLEGPGVALPGIWIVGRITVGVEGIAVVGHDIGFEIPGPATAQIRDVLVDDNQWLGMLAAGSANVTLERTAVRNTRPRPNGTSGRGLSVQTGASVTVIDSELEGHQEFAVYASGPGTQVTLRSVVVGGTRTNPAGEGGTAIHVQAPATAVLERVAILDNEHTALRVTGEGASATGVDIYADGHPKGGVVVRLSATATLDAVTIRDSGGLGATSIGAKTTLDLTNALVIATRESDEHGISFGLIAAEGGVLRATRTAVIDSDHRGAYAEGPGSAVGLTDVLIDTVVGDLAPGAATYAGGFLEILGSTIRNTGAAGVLAGGEDRIVIADSIIEETRPHGGEEVGAGIVGNAGTVTVERTAIRNNFSLGVVIGNLRESGDLTITDSTIHHTRGRPMSGDFEPEGFGIWVSSGSTLAVTGCDLFENQFAAVGVHDGARATIDRSVLRLSRLNEAGSFGEGLYAEGVVDVTDSLFFGNKTIGIQANGEGARVRVLRSLVDETSEKVEGFFGHGLAVSNGGRLIVDRSEIRANAGAGIVIAAGAGLVIRSVFTTNRIGLHASEGITLVSSVDPPVEPVADYLYVSDDTLFIGNETRIGGGMIPIPASTDGPRALGSSAP